MNAICVTGLDYFGARYFSGAQGRFTSPDAPFADQHPEDPQSWNLYTYARNNPLRFVDPFGREAVSKEQCDQNSDCVRLQLNVVYDRNADIYDDRGNVLPQYQKSVDDQIARARDEYGTLGIYLDVTTTQGAVDGIRKGISDGAVASAVNLAVTDAAVAPSPHVAGCRVRRQLSSRTCVILT